MESLPPDTIDEARLLSLRPAAALARIHPDEALLPLSPALLLPHLRGALLELPSGLGAWLQPALRAAAGMDAPFCVGVEGDPGKGARGGIHGAVAEAWTAVRAAHFRRPVVLHGRLGLCTVDDTDAVDAARVRVLEAIDAGVTSAQLGGLGAPSDVAVFLAGALAPLVDNGLAAVVHLADAAQAAELPALLEGKLDVTAWTGTATRARPFRGAHPVTDGASWLDITAAVGARIRTTLADHADVAGVAGLQALWSQKEHPARDRLESRILSEVEDLLTSLRARGDAGRAMAALSVPEPDAPFE